MPTTEIVALKNALCRCILKMKGIDLESIELPIKGITKQGKEIILQGETHC